MSHNYKNFMGQNIDNEISNLKNELSKANKIIEQQKITINDLQNKINNYNIQIIKTLLIKKA